MQRNRDKQTINLLLLTIVLATIVGYYPVLFDFFAGDDFVHLDWLSLAVKYPELIWRNFYSSWLDGTTTKFYRPLISIFMVTDYLVWRLNGFGFHVTNLAFHLASTGFVFGIVYQLCMRFGIGRRSGNETAAQQEKRNLVIWCAMSSALFGLYPLHCEAVSWITGRVDAIVSTFFLGSLLAFMLWRTRVGPKKNKWMFLSLASMALGLLSKEMAIVLPAVFFVYELCVPPFPSECKGAEGSRARMLRALVVTLPFWFLLAIYFVVRLIALGTFVGGYDDSLFHVADVKGFFLTWVHGLRMMVVPLNKDFLGAHSLLTKAWEVTLAVVSLLVILNLIIEPRIRRPALFLVLLFGLSLIPVYKVFAIADDLQSSRFAYLATAPLCMLFALCSFAPRPGKGPSGTGLADALDRLRVGLPVLFPLLALIVLWTNNKAWEVAGDQANAIRGALDRLYRTINGDPQVLLVGMPDQLNGAYVCRNALVGMLKPPQFFEQVNNCQMVGPYEPIFPFGFIKESLSDSRDYVKIFKWDKELWEFYPVYFSESPAPTVSTIWEGDALKEVLRLDAEGSFKRTWLGDGSLELIAAPQKDGRPTVKFQPRPPLDCYNVDFVAVTVENLGDMTDAGAYKDGCDLLYANELAPNFEFARRTSTKFDHDKKQQTLIFSLHALPEWVLGGRSRGLELRLPRRSHVRIVSAEIVPPAKIMPICEFPNSGYLGTKGFLHIAEGKPSVPILIDAMHLPGAKKVTLEVTRTNLLFNNQNSAEPSQNIMTVWKGRKAVAELTLKRSDFPALGLYEARARAFDAEDRPLGVAGDHFVISVDPPAATESPDTTK